MSLVFADAFYFFAILNPGDEAHERAVEFSRAARSPLLSTAWILTELADGLCRSANRRVFRALLEEIQADPDSVIVPPSEEDFEKGVTLYDSRHDKDWSLTDCISFVVMDRYNVREALTGDHHFEQAGFTALLKSN